MLRTAFRLGIASSSEPAFIGDLSAASLLSCLTQFSGVIPKMPLPGCPSSARRTLRGQSTPVVSTVQTSSQRRGVQALHASAAAPRPPAAATSGEAPDSLLDAQAISSTLPTSWLAHWQHREEHRRFQRQVVESTRGRQAQRQRWLLDTVAATSSSDTEDELGLCISNGRFRVPMRRETGGSTQAAGPGNAAGASDEMDDLTWLASHPEAAGFSPEDGQPAVPTSAGWTQQAADQANAGAVQLVVASEAVTVRPLWISVFQPREGGPAHLFESVVPLEPGVIDRVRLDVTPFCTVSGLKFGAFADLQHGAWANYFVGLVGDVAVEEADILWPNQVLHQDRVLYNVRHAGDIANFLADARREDVEAHMENLVRLAEERQYRRGWSWHMLRARWGKAVLDEFAVTLT